MPKPKTRVNRSIIAEIHQANKLLSKAANTEEMSSFEKQENSLLESLKIAERLFTMLEELSPDSAGVYHKACEHLLLKVMRRLGVFYAQHEDFVMAKILFERGLDLCQLTLGVECIQYFELLGHLAMARFELGEYSDSEELCRQSIEMSKRLYGKVNVLGWYMTSFLARCYRAQGEELMATLTEKQAEDMASKIDFSAFESYLRPSKD